MQKLPGKFSYFPVNEYWNFLNRSNEALEQYNKKFDFLREDRKGQNKYEESILIDCANGVSGFSSEKIKNIFKNDKLTILMINTLFKNFSFLNEFCGAYYIFLERNLPMNYPVCDKTSDNSGVYNAISKNAAFDGDVERLIYL